MWRTETVHSAVMLPVDKALVRKEAFCLPNPSPRLACAVASVSSTRVLFLTLPLYRSTVTASTSE